MDKESLEQVETSNLLIKDWFSDYADFEDRSKHTANGSKRNEEVKTPKRVMGRSKIKDRFSVHSKEDSDVEELSGSRSRG